MSDTQDTQVATRENRAPAQGRERRPRFVRPYYEIHGDNEAHYVDVYLPGVPKDEVSVNLDRRQLTIEGRRRPAGENWHPIHREIVQADFRLQLNLNVDVDDSKISASQDNGVLTVKLPVAEAAKPRQIKIK